MITLCSNQSTADIAEDIQNLYQEISGQSDLSPNNPILNKALNKLVATIVKLKNNPIAEQEIVEKLSKTEIFQQFPSLCAQAEFKMEKWWSSKITKAQNPILALKKFWYLNSYRNLCQCEFPLIKQADPRRIIFLGSGPLPLSILLYAKEFPNSKLVSVDSDVQALTAGQEFLATQNLTSVEHTQCCAEEFRFKDGDLPIYASLIRGKDIYYNLINSQARHAIVRDSQGLVQLLYKPAIPITPPFVKVAEASSDLSLNTAKLFSRNID